MPPDRGVRGKCWPAFLSSAGTSLRNVCRRPIPIGGLLAQWECETARRREFRSLPKSLNTEPKYLFSRFFFFSQRLPPDQKSLARVIYASYALQIPRRRMNRTLG